MRDAVGILALQGGEDVNEHNLPNRRQRGQQRQPRRMDRHQRERRALKNHAAHSPTTARGHDVPEGEAVAFGRGSSGL